MPKKTSGRRAGRARPTPASADRRRALRVVGIVLAIVVLLYVLASLIATKVDPAGASTVGAWGRGLGDWLFLALGWMSFALVLTAAGTLAVALMKPRPWRRYSSLRLLLGGLLITACLLSWQTGRPFAADNFGGWLGALIAGGLTRLLGLGAYVVPALLFIWGRRLWPRETDTRAGLAASGHALLAGLFLVLYLGHFAPAATWNPAPPLAPDFSPAGQTGTALAGLLHCLIGTVGTFILLVAALAVTVALVASPRLGLPTARLKQLIARLRARSRRPAVPATVPARDRDPAPPAVPDPTPAGTSPAPAPAAPVVEPDAGPRPAPARPRRQPLRDFDLSKFQQAFLDQLDQPGPEDRQFKDPRESEREAATLVEKLGEFGITGRISAIESGPMVTRFELEPAPGIKIQRIGALADDLALALSAERIRILAPIPGKSAVGIEIPNKNRLTVHLREILTSEAFASQQTPLGFALGTDITGEPWCADITKMPHILIAGTTGSGKSVCINSIIASVIYRASHRQVRLLCIDPKQLELPIYNSIPHLINRTTTDPKKAVDELAEVVKIMEVRYGEFANLGVRDIASYNKRAVEEGLEPKPYIVVVIDELADLMLRAPTEIEERITRLAQMSRAVGIHLVLATQRPSVDVITGLIKANFPCRVAFQVASKTDSRTILDMNGAEALLGRGDMLFLPPGKGDPVRLHGSFISADAAIRVVNLWTVAWLTERLAGRVDDAEGKARQLVERDVVDVFFDPAKRNIRRKREALLDILPEEVADELLGESYYDPLPEVRSGAIVEHEQRVQAEARTLDEKIEDAARVVVRHKEASVSMLQRRLDVGWARAGRIIDQLQDFGIVGPFVGSKSRTVLVESEAQLEPLLKQMRNPVPPVRAATEESGAPEPAPEDDYDSPMGEQQ
ncbi:MAG TPA: DNA translocase FtsK [candidate division WOR-3 bacterium]|uniref:DNA translocase FtsK n=1 Tax=candidate division WOR-3 bacterium TaxID=2052148 RepID=A0A7V0T7H4_UNCW3|nr:DNA translocase FtsK [candidate division WOR-3 bacterium]